MDAKDLEKLLGVGEPGVHDCEAGGCQERYEASIDRWSPGFLHAPAYPGDGD